MIHLLNSYNNKYNMVRFCSIAQYDIENGLMVYDKFSVEKGVPMKEIVKVEEVDELPKQKKSRRC